MKFRQARRVADALVEQWGPWCERIAVAGSIRRERPEVKDIEIVAIPRWETRAGEGQGGLFDGAPVERVNLLQEHIEAEERLSMYPIKPGTHEIEPWPLTSDGRYWRLHIPLADLKVDVFLADAETWGLTYMIRTGAAEFSMAMLARWKAVTGGGYSHAARLHWPDTRIEPAPEEEDVFRACRVEWVEPQRRTDASAVTVRAVEPQEAEA